tara:strand:+ start:891 stop:1442 length:552 start_codon:yes stop_codon:yes gene_type:complete
MPVNAPNDDLDILAPSFNLKNINDEMIALDSAKGLNGTVIVFICNHCPYVKAIASRLKKDADDLLEHSINTIAIMSNDVINYPDDSFDNMKIFSKKYNFNFPYLYDETQEIAKKYNAVCTPDFFGFDKNLQLKYRGRIDSGIMKTKKNNEINRDLFNAMIKIKNEGVGPSEQFNSIGCSIKWK